MLGHATLRPSIQNERPDRGRLTAPSNSGALLSRAPVHSPNLETSWKKGLRLCRRLLDKKRFFRNGDLRGVDAREKALTASPPSAGRTSPSGASWPRAQGDRSRGCKRQWPVNSFTMAGAPQRRHVRARPATRRRRSRSRAAARFQPLTRSPFPRPAQDDPRRQLERRLRFLLSRLDARVPRFSLVRSVI
jgi:hypothetical protein